MKFPGWYPSVQYPGKMQWWDGYKFTDKTRYMEPHEKYDRGTGSPNSTVTPVKEKPKLNLDWLLVLPLTLGGLSLLWLAFAVVPFATGERTITYEKVNATITRVHTESKRSSDDNSFRIFGRKSTRTQSSTRCTVYVNAVIDGQGHTGTAGDNCQRATGMKTEMTYDPKDIQETLSSAPMPPAQMNVVAAAATSTAFFGAAGFLQWMRTPLEERKKRKPRKKRKTKAAK